MIQSHVTGVEFICANTDAQALNRSTAHRTIQLGETGLGAGSRPHKGRAAAELAEADIRNAIEGANMLFITAGMGGGTGTGAAPVIARAVRELGILTVGVVTKPFHFEGDRRMKQAERGIEELQNYVDTLIIIPNQNLFRVATERTTFAQAFTMADEVLHSGVRGITDLIVMPGLINRDFADIKTVMSEMGKAMMGTGEMDGENRALRAAEAAISNPLLDEVSMKGARAVLVAFRKQGHRAQRPSVRGLEGGADAGDQRRPRRVSAGRLDVVASPADSGAARPGAPDSAPAGTR
jgi:cell division protein FtsZ